MPAPDLMNARPRRTVLADVSRGDLLSLAELRPDRFGDALAPGVDAEMFRELLGSFPSGVTIVTCRDTAGTPVGLTATAIASVSLLPPQLLICVAEGKYTLEAIRRTGRFAVNILAGNQVDLSRRFATPHPDKFAGVEWVAGPRTNVPLLAGAVAHAECEVAQIVPAGDHAIVIGTVVAGDAEGGPPLLYHARRYASWKELDE